MTARAGLAVLAAALCAAACTTVTTQTYRIPQERQIESAYIATDADFGRYDTLQPERLGIFFPTGRPLDADDAAQLRTIFREAFLQELEGYALVGEPGPTTMIVQASLIDLRNDPIGGVTDLRPELRDLARPGSLVFLMEMRDSQSGRVLARAADSAAAQAVVIGGNEDWSGVEESAAHWAQLFRRFLDQNLAR